MPTLSIDSVHRLVVPFGTSLAAFLFVAGAAGLGVSYAKENEGVLASPGFQEDLIGGEVIGGARDERPRDQEALG